MRKVNLVRPRKSLSVDVKIWNAINMSTTFLLAQSNVDDNGSCKLAEFESSRPLILFSRGHSIAAGWSWSPVWFGKQVNMLVIFHCKVTKA